MSGIYGIEGSHPSRVNKVLVPVPGALPPATMSGRFAAGDGVWDVPRVLPPSSTIHSLGIPRFHHLPFRSFGGILTSDAQLS